MPSDDLRSQVRRAIADALGVDPSALASPATTETVEEWDSLGHFQVIELLVGRFGMIIPHDEAVGLVTEDAIVDALVRRRSQ